MAKGRLIGSFSHFLYTVGNAIHFAPASAFAPPKTEKETAEREKPFAAVRLKMKTALAKMCEQSFFLGLYSAFLRNLFTTRVRSFGVLLFSCGFLQILSFFLGGYLSFAAGDEGNLLFGVVLVILSLLCSFTRGEAKDVLKKSFFYRGFLKPLFGSDGWEFPVGRSSDHFFTMILAGSLLALFSVVFSPLFLLLAVLFLALVSFVFYQPEAGLVTVALTFTCVPFRVTVLLTALTLIAFLCKCAVGKRTVVFSWQDATVLFALFPLLFSEKGRWLFPMLATLYFVSPGLLRTLASIRRLLCALMLGGVFCSVMILARYVFSTFFSELLFRFPNLDRLLFLEAGEAILAPIVMIFPLAVGFFRSPRNTAGLIFSPLVYLVFFGVAFCTGSPILWIALLIALAVQNVMTRRFSLFWHVAFALILITALNVIPAEWLQYAFGLFGFTADAVTAGEGVLSLLGVGKVLGILILAVLLGYFLFTLVKFHANATKPEAFPRVLGAACSAIAFVAMNFGGVAADERSLVVFVLLLAVPRVSLICAKREEIRLPY